MARESRSQAEVVDVGEVEPIKLEWTPKAVPPLDSSLGPGAPRPPTPDFLKNLKFETLGGSGAPSPRIPRQQPEPADPPQNQPDPPDSPQKQEAFPASQSKQEAQRAKEDDRRQRLIEEVARISKTDASNFMQLLELNMGYTMKELDQRKRALVLLLHPDKASTLAQDAALAAQARCAYDAVCNAYEAAKNQQSWQPWQRPAPSGPHASPPCSQPPPSQSFRYRCAHSGCQFFVTISDFGGFCCKKCHAAFLRGSPSQHGSRCHQRVAESSIPRADPVPPANPLA